MVVRWRFVDPVAGEVPAQYTVAYNPSEMTSPFPTKAVTLAASSAVRGQPMLIEGAVKATDWSFSGTILNQDHYDALALWVAKDHPIVIWDHYGRDWLVYLIDFAPVPKRAIGVPWRHNYSIKCMLFGRASGVTAPSLPPVEVQPPTSPYNVALANSPQPTEFNGVGTVVVKWAQPYSGGSPITSYEIVLRNTDAGTNYAAVSASGTATTLTIPNVALGAHHTATIHSVNAVGDGPTGTSPAAYVVGRPTVPRSFTATIRRTPFGDVAFLQWQAPLNTGGYPVYYIVTMQGPDGILHMQERYNYSGYLTGLTSWFPIVNEYLPTSTGNWPINFRVYAYNKYETGGNLGPTAGVKAADLVATSVSSVATATITAPLALAAPAVPIVNAATVGTLDIDGGAVTLTVTAGHGGGRYFAGWEIVYAATDGGASIPGGLLIMSGNGYIDYDIQPPLAGAFPNEYNLDSDGTGMASTTCIVTSDEESPVLQVPMGRHFTVKVRAVYVAAYGSTAYTYSAYSAVRTVVAA